MRFEILLFATLIAGALSRHEAQLGEVDNVFYSAVKSEFPKQVHALKLEGLQLPDLEFSVAATSVEFPERKVTLTQGKVEGLSTVVTPRGPCFPEEYEVFTCHVTFDGLRVTYEARASNPDETFKVEVYAAHTLLDVTLAKGDGHYEVKGLKLRSLFLWNRLPREFTNDPEQNVVFENELKLKLLPMIEKETLTGTVKQAFLDAVASQKY